MAEMTIDREGIVFCSKYHNFYAYKNLRKRIELLLYKYYEKGANNWILLSRDGDILKTYTYSFSLDFTTHISDGTVIKGAFDEATLHLLFFLMTINGLKVMTAIDEENKEVYHNKCKSYVLNPNRLA